MERITADAVRGCIATHAPVYSWRKPVYQSIALESLQRLWDPAHRNALDVGGGTGLIAHATKRLFGLDRVVSIDVKHRYRPMLDINAVIYDGTRLPFRDASFDCVLLFNVLHHVPIGFRPALIRECRRIAGRGPLYIKDHLSMGAVDDARLALLDALGNIPFGGMVSASYLSESDWNRLAAETSHREGVRLSGRYRGGPLAAIFPNRLEISMRWQPN
ncbi:MAG: methyltransferase domain-containing protein [Steroidobacteraceae bacterium]